MQKILIVDDDLSLAKLIKIRFESDNYEVKTAANGALALEAVEVDMPALIILDVMMPGMDGLTFLRELKRKKPDCPVPVIILTGRKGLKPLFELESVKGFMLKPLDVEDLLKKVNHLLRPESDDSVKS